MIVASSTKRVQVWYEEAEFEPIGGVFKLQDRLGYK